MTVPRLTHPADIDLAYRRYGANCGPCSLAAVLGRSVMGVKALLPAFTKGRDFTNVTDMKGALARAGCLVEALGPHLPRYGLVFLQWGGHSQKPIRAQYTYTHWIATQLVADGQGTRLVCEVSAPYLVTWAEWQRVMPAWAKEEALGDGTFVIRGGYEVRRAGVGGET